MGSRRRGWSVLDHRQRPVFAAIEGFHAEDRDHVFGGGTPYWRSARSSALRWRSRTRRLGDAPSVRKLAAVFLPGAPLRRSLHRLQHWLGGADAREHGKELALDETVALDQLADERAHLRAFRIAGLLRSRRGNQRQEDRRKSVSREPQLAHTGGVAALTRACAPREPLAQADIQPGDAQNGAPRAGQRACRPRRVIAWPLRAARSVDAAAPQLARSTPGSAPDAGAAQ